MTSHGQTLRVGTLNVRSLTGKVGAVAALAAEARVNVLAMQETMISQDSIKATANAFRAAGWELHRGSQGLDARGGACSGVAFITDVPAQLVAIPTELEFGGRIAAIKVARLQQRPLLVLSIYMPAADKVAGNTVAQEAVQWARNTGEAYVLLGDWNRREDAYPLAGYLAKGVVWSMDGEQCPRAGTHRRGGHLRSHIDFGLASPRLLVEGREQHVGVADHDLVSYQLRAHPGEDTRRWRPQRRLLVEEPAAWESVWADYADAFEVAIVSRDVTTAWQTLSAAAEAAMADPTSRPAKPRAEPGRPLVQDRHHGRCRDVQTLLERRLRRVARRAAEAARGGTARLKEKLDRDVAAFTLDYPCVLDMPSYADLACYLNQLADEEAQRARAARIRRWKDEIQDDVSAMAKWITARDSAEASSPQRLGECPSKGAAAQRLTESLGQLWGEAENVNMAGLESFLGALGPDRAACDHPVKLDGHLLMRRTRRAKAKAGGLDGWSGPLFSKLPLAFFERLSQVWMLVLEGCGVPDGWRQIRVVAIPKTDGGLRPLALTQMAWRVGTSELLSQLRSWFGQWMPPELCGGLPGRSADIIHEDLGNFVQRRATSRTFVGCKADVRKCFDRVSPTVALRILRWWGAPLWFVNLVADFYESQERWVTVAGIFTAQPVRACCSLLQGCPFSALLVNSMMAAWALHVKRRVPTIRMGIFLDDRTLYTKGIRAVADLVAAATAGQEADRAMGFELHPDKLASFGCHVQRREALLEYADLLGVPQTDFLLLGVNYRLEGHQAFAAQDVTEALKSRGRRISRVAATTSMRARLASLLMVSKFRFRAPWTRFSKTSVRTWASQVEAAVWGGPLATGRSAFLLWTFVGVDLHPEFAIAATVLKKEWRRLGGGGVGSPGPQVAAALSKLCWSTRGTRFLTPLGTFSAEELTALGFQERLREAWRRVLWNRDTKTTEELGANRVPVLRPHRQFGRNGKARTLRIAAAAATDGRDLARLNVPKACACGEVDPTRHHLTFECPRRPWEGNRRTEQERRLLCAVVEDPGYEFAAADDEEEHIGNLAALLATKEDGILIATDGGAMQLGEHYRWRCASWAVVVDGQAFSGLVRGEERTAAAGERTAFSVLCRAAVLAQRQVKVLVEADKAATAQLQRLVGWWTRLRRDIADAEDWSWRALRTQLDATNEWHESLKQAMQRRNELRRLRPSGPPVMSPFGVTVGGYTMSVCRPFRLLLPTTPNRRHGCLDTLHELGQGAAASCHTVFLDTTTALHGISEPTHCKALAQSPADNGFQV